MKGRPGRGTPDLLRPSLAPVNVCVCVCVCGGVCVPPSVCGVYFVVKEAKARDRFKDDKRLHIM